MRKLLIRLFYGLLFALPLMLMTFAFAQAQEGTQPKSTGPAKLICPACHETFQETWETSAHGRPESFAAFKKTWEGLGQQPECLTCHVTNYNPDTNTYDAEGINCSACHDTATANHPANPMAADRSSKACGTCHAETYFEWQSSKHREAGLDCVGCHDPHNTGLKAEDSYAMCATCHRERASNFAHSQHSAQGLVCADCHMANLTDTAIDGHARMDHSFTVRLSTCNQCHEYQMHDPSQVHPESPTPVSPDTLSTSNHLAVATDPSPANPLGFATLAGLFGLAAGVIVAPWVDKLNRNKRQ